VVFEAYDRKNIACVFNLMVAGNIEQPPTFLVLALALKYHLNVVDTAIVIVRTRRLKAEFGVEIDKMTLGR
jgi:hypothetical protein